MEFQRSGFLKNCFQRSATPLLRFVYGGIGSIVMLHRVIEGEPGPRIEKRRRLMEIFSRVLKEMIFHMRKLPFEFNNKRFGYEMRNALERERVSVFRCRCKQGGRES